MIIYCVFYVFRLWYVGLTYMLRGIRKQMSLVDRSMLWLKELYIQLYYENGSCEPLASDSIKVIVFNLKLIYNYFKIVLLSTKAFGGADYSFLSTTTSTPDSVHNIKKDLTQQQIHQQSNQLLAHQQSTPTLSSSGMKKKKSVVNLFSCNQPQQSSPSPKNLPIQHMEQNQFLTQSSQNLHNQQQSNPSSLCDTSSSTSNNISSSKQFSAFNNISFDTNLDFLSFVSLYRSFR